MKSENFVGVIYAEDARYNAHDTTYWFRPSEAFPELEDSCNFSEKNDVYAAVRKAFYMMDMDAEHYGQKEWNPLGEVISPGDTVLIKPNMVMDYNRSGEGTDCLYTNPQVVAPVIDYVLIALRGKGKLIVGDAPMQECRFQKLVSESGYSELIDYYKNIRKTDIKLEDFRGLITTEKGKHRKGVRYQSIRENAYGKIINLGEKSAFYGFDEKHLSNLRITNYSPDRLRQHHTGETQEYYVSGHVLDADVVIDMPKPKTHRKAGFTAAMKNMVGINVRKEYLPHHTIGAVEDGGDEYLKRSWLRKIDDKLYDMKNTCEGKAQYKRAFVLWYVAGALKVLASWIYHDEGEGSWYGNETISKTIVDLNKILNYADKDGRIQRERQRRILHIGDMIVSGEKEGPVAPSPKNVGAIIISENAYGFDYVVGTMMGARIREIPFIKDAITANTKYELLPKGNIQIVSNNGSIDGLEPDRIDNMHKWMFTATRGWKTKFLSLSNEERI